MTAGVRTGKAQNKQRFPLCPRKRTGHAASPVMLRTTITGESWQPCRLLQAAASKACRISTVNDDLLSSDIGRSIRCKEDCDSGKIARLSPAPKRDSAVYPRDKGFVTQQGRS